MEKTTSSEANDTFWTAQDDIQSADARQCCEDVACVVANMCDGIIWTYKIAENKFDINIRFRHEVPDLKESVTFEISPTRLRVNRLDQGVKHQVLDLEWTGIRVDQASARARFRTRCGSIVITTVIYVDQCGNNRFYGG